MTEEQKLIQETAYKFTVNEIEPIAKDCDREERYPRDVWKKACETGLVGAFIPEEYGGPGFGFVELALIAEQLSRIDLGIGTVIITAILSAIDAVKAGSAKNVMVCAGDMRIGKAGDRQIKDPKIGLTHNMGGFSAGT